MPPHGNDQCDKKVMILKIAKTIFLFSLIFWVTIFFGKMLVSAIQKQERIDCKTWDTQARELSGFFLTKAQDEQCQRWGIIINTTVRN